MRRQQPPSQMFERSSNYRANFLKHKKGFFGIYTCAYCGKLVYIQLKRVLKVERSF